MLQTLRRIFRPSKSDSLARALSRLGWIGFWIQVAIGAIPLALIVYAFVFGRDAGTGTRGGFALVRYLAVAGLLVLAFTTLWSFWYTRVAKRIADATRRPSEQSVRRTAWIGVAASALGIVLSMLVMLFEIAQLLIYFLRAPQAGIPVIQTTSGGQASWISAADIVHLLALNLTMFGEIIILAFSLWLLFRTTLPSVEFPHAGGEE
jgi:Protein of unknown function (DUF3611)